MRSFYFNLAVHKTIKQNMVWKHDHYCCRHTIWKPFDSIKSFKTTIRLMIARSLNFNFMLGGQRLIWLLLNQAAFCFRSFSSRRERNFGHESMIGWVMITKRPKVNQTDDDLLSQFHGIGSTAKCFRQHWHMSRYESRNHYEPTQWIGMQAIGERWKEVLNSGHTWKQHRLR